MIIDTIENLSFYEQLLPGIGAGWLQFQKLKEITDNKYEFNGGYFMLQKGKTKPLSEGTFEAHKKYADVQIVLEGCEEIAWMPVSQLSAVSSYDDKKDVIRLNGSRMHHMTVTAGMFYIVFPDDGHKAVSHTDAVHDFTKCVMKIRIMNRN